MKRVLVTDPDRDVWALLEKTLVRLGYEPVRAGADGPPPGIDAVVLEPGSRECRSLLRRFGAALPPLVCFSIYPREAGLEPSGTVAYLVKPSSQAQLAAVLGAVLGP